MTLIYCAHSLIDQTVEPDWLQKLLANPMVEAESWVLYRPTLGFMENIQQPGLLSALTRPPKVSREASAELRVDPEVFEPLSKVHGRLQAADGGPFLDVAFKRLYALLRADIVLVDMNVPDHGCRAQEAMYAYLANIPVIGVAHRFIVSPAMLEKVEAVVFPRTSDQIVRQILAFDHKVTAAIQHYREREQQRGKLQQLGQQLADLKAEQEAESSDGGDEGSGQVHGTSVSGAVS